MCDIIKNLLENMYNLKEYPKDFEKNVKNWLDDNKVIEIKNNESSKNYDICYHYQPHGKQNSPDFHIYVKGIKEPFSIECKSTKKSNYPMWNSGLPDIHKNYIYLYYNGNKKLCFVFMAKHVISLEEQEKLKKFHDKLKKTCKDFSSSTNFFGCYPRINYNQKIKLDIKDHEKFYNDCIEFINSC